MALINVGIARVVLEIDVTSIDFELLWEIVGRTAHT